MDRALFRLGRVSASRSLLFCSLDFGGGLSASAKAGEIKCVCVCALVRLKAFLNSPPQTQRKGRYRSRLNSNFWCWAAQAQGNRESRDVSPVQRLCSTPLSWKSSSKAAVCFADDLFVFGKASSQNDAALKVLLQDFSCLSGLNINHGKSSLFFANCSGGTQALFEDTLGIAAGSLPITYLGVPIASRGLKASDFQVLISKVEQKISTWKARVLSFASRVVLIKSVVMGCISHWVNVFRLPQHTVDVLERMMAKFLWKGNSDSGMHKVAWPAVHRPKEEGGLGLHRLRDWNTAALMRHVWSISSSDRSGRETLLWSDPWLPHGPIAKPGMLIANALGRSCFDIVHSIQCDDGVWDNSVGDVALLDRWDEIVSTKVHRRFEGDLTASSTGKFTLKSAWESVRMHGGEVGWHRLVWFSNAQPRFSFVTWLAVLGRLATRCLLACWGLVSNISCYLCQVATETLDHLLFQCAFSSGIWKSILRLNGFSREPLGSWGEEIDWLVGHFGGDSFLCRVRKFSFNAVVYRVWQERNARAFHMRTCSAEGVFRRVILDTQAKFFDLPSRTALNCDGSMKNGLGGYGAIGRGCLGVPVFAVAGRLLESNVVIVELHAIMRGLAKAKEMGLSQIRGLRDAIRNCSFCHHVREINSCADYLAGFTYSPQELHFCPQSLPVALSELVQKDATGKRYFRL
ncbi:uncharacterized protein LOC122666093 [Telopea speciosissima]|uniref:uncharacterized protein LOC122666093 n=1 Tax=Telopea speciosissima TaxID=54955 RepID=UPI001CC73B30|nr:uncharacterized protein LOC122666093 [Telopea speciosissima]